MRKLTHYITPGLMAAALLLAPAMAYRVVAQETPTPAATPAPNDAECEDLNNKVRAQIAAKNSAGAYEAGKAYLAKCGERTDDFTPYVKNMVTKYEAAKVQYDFDKERAKGASGSPSVIYQNGRILIAKTPDNLDVIVPLAYYGAAAFEKKDASYKTDAVNYTKQAIQKIEAGGAPVKWDPFVSKDQALGWLYHGLAALLLESSPAEAQGYLFKSNTFNSTDLPKAADLYKLADSYDVTEVDKARKELQKFEGQPVTPESEAAKTKFLQVTDRAIDYYARAIAAMGTETKYDALRTDAKTALTAYYKYRHPELEKTIDASVTSYVAGVNKTPMPDPKSPLPELPKPATPPAGSGGSAPTGTTGAGSGNTSSAAGTSGGSNAGPRPVSAGTPAPAKATPSPAAPPKPAAAKPPTKMKRNHR